MDKNQKTLLDTYLRKRKLTANRLEYENYELEYTINNNIIDLQNLTAENIVYICLYHPRLVTNLNLKKLLNNNRKIIRILIKRPELFKILDSTLNLTSIFNSRDIADAITNNADLINYLNTDNLEGDGLVDVLQYNPDLIKNLIPNLDYLSIRNVRKILSEQPQLKPYFTEHFRIHNIISNTITN